MHEEYVTRVDVMDNEGNRIDVEVIVRLAGEPKLFDIQRSIGQVCMDTNRRFEIGMVTDG